MAGLQELVKEAEVRPGTRSEPRARAPGPVSAIISAEEDGDVPLYAPRREIYPQSVSGTFRRIKWTLLIVGCAV